MPTIQHPDIRPVSGDPTAGPHVIHYWEVADNTARDALTLVANDIGRVCRVGSAAPYTFFVLINNTGPAWDEIGGGGGGDVTSVFGRTGAVTAQTGDYTAAQVTGAVPDTRTITAGTGLSGGGNLSANRTLAVTYGSTASTACEGNDSRLSDSRAPNGSAGGDLGGTYPNPTVSQARGLRETAGPTTLSMGAVSDGQYLRRSGSDVVGANPNAAVSPTTESGTTRTLADSDHGLVILCTNASGCAVTVPHTLTAGFTCTLVQRGTAAVSASGSGGLTVSPPAAFNATTAQLNSPLTIYVESATVGLCWGDLDPV